VRDVTKIEIEKKKEKQKEMKNDKLGIF